MFVNPGASRTLDPNGRSFLSVVGIHDQKLSDADLNLLEALQNSKKTSILKNQVCSGVLSSSPFQFSARGVSPQPLQFTVPAFNVLMNGELVTIGGNLAQTLTSNLVQVPFPSFWSPGSSSPEAGLYVVFIEFWYQRINPATGQGYFIDSVGNRFFYANGCINSNPLNNYPDDTIDPFDGIPTTERSQIQWAIRTQPLQLSYDFTQFSYGLDYDTNLGFGAVPQAGQPLQSTQFSYINMAAINGDAGLWRAGDGNYLNSLGTLDGYSYAMPLAIVFQRNTGTFSIDQNPFGAADSNVQGTSTTISGTITSSGANASTGRFDGKFADVIFPDDVLDTRGVISLPGFDEKTMMEEAFVDLISGQTSCAIQRGASPGSSNITTGSTLDYSIAVAPETITNTDTVGSFDGYRNGFSAASFTSYTTVSVNVSQKTVGTNGVRWQQGDSFTVQLPNSSQAVIEFAQVQGLVTNVVSAVSTPVLYLAGQIAISGLGSKIITITIIKNLIGTTYDPGTNPIYITLGVEYPANGGLDLRYVVDKIWGGSLTDGTTSQTLPVYGVDFYTVQSPLALVKAYSAYAYNPFYSNLVFGTRVVNVVAGSSGVYGTDINNNPITTFTLSLAGLNGNLTGLYVILAVDQLSGSIYNITNRSTDGTNLYLQIQGSVPTTTSLLMTWIAANTVQMCYNPPIKGIVAIEETVLAGTSIDAEFSMDPRISVVSVKNTPGVNNIAVLATVNGLVTGLAGDDSNKLVWIKGTNGQYTSIIASSVVISNGFVTITVSPTVNLQVQEWYVVAALNPAFSVNSQLTLIENYTPYQGEGRMGRDYELVYTENTALITTNGTGAAPLPGLQDVYPYNREFPIVAALPSQVTWSDAGLSNQPVAATCDSNYEDKLFENVEHTFSVPLHTNDFIQPFTKGKRMTLQLTTPSGSRGYAEAEPHIGFAIRSLTGKLSVGAAVTTTTASLTFFVNNVTGNDNNDGMSPVTPFLTIGAALNALPVILRHPCSIQLMPTNQSYLINNLQNSLQTVALGEGVVLAAKYYALGILSFTIQDSGRLVITAQAGTNGNVTIDATGFTGFGDGPTAAFFLNNTRAIFNQITFSNFTDPAIKALDSYVEFVNCNFTNNAIAGSFEQGCSIILTDGKISMSNYNQGFILSSSDMESYGTSLILATNTITGPFFTAERGSSLTLANHNLALETNILTSSIIATAQLNSSIVVGTDWTSNGNASLLQNSVLSRTVAINPFIGGVTADTSSNVTTSV